MAENKRLGELLVERGLIKPWQVEIALQTQRTTKAFLGEIIVRKGWLSEEALLQALAEQFGLQFVHLTPEETDWSVVGHFSPSSGEGHPCVAISADSRTVTAAIANPLDAWVISALEQRAGSRTVRLVLATTNEIRATLRWAQQQASQALRNTANQTRRRVE